MMRMGLLLAALGAAEAPLLVLVSKTELKNDCACVRLPIRRDIWHENIDFNNTFKTLESLDFAVKFQLVFRYETGVQEICLITLTGRSFAKVSSLSGLPNSYLR